MTSPVDSPRSTAVISDDGKHRFALTRLLNSPTAHAVMFVMLNPSTADADTDDPTIRKCIGFAERWGYGKLLVANLYSTRATEPKELTHSYVADEFWEDDTWPLAEQWIRKMASEALTVVCAWGAFKSPFKWYREMQVGQALAAAGHDDGTLECLGRNKDGTPKHPLYLPWDTDLEDYRYATGPDKLVKS